MIWVLLAVVAVITAVHALVELLGLNRWVVMDPSSGYFLTASYGTWSDGLSSAWSTYSRSEAERKAAFWGGETVRFTRAVLSA